LTFKGFLISTVKLKFSTKSLAEIAEKNPDQSWPIMRISFARVGTIPTEAGALTPLHFMNEAGPGLALRLKPELEKAKRPC
jgi:hypothetical protein